MTFDNDLSGDNSPTFENSTEQRVIPLPSPKAAVVEGGTPKAPVRVRQRVRPVAAVKVPKRQISTIGFPYVDLEAVIGVARAMNDVGGLALTRDQLAGALKQSPGSGAFILKISAARQYGVLEQTQGGKFQLTSLGFSIVSRDEHQEKAARADAFLSVQLFKKAYDEFKGRQLPPRPLGLESAFVQFGVSAKQKDTARQVFEKAARQAGFFNVDPDRLIEPVAGVVPQAEKTAPDPVVSQAPATVAVARMDQLDPLIQGLVDRLPEPGTVWEPEKRVRWLQTLAANFDMVYETELGSVVVVEVKARRSGE